MARISGIRIIETRERGTAKHIGFYSGGLVLADRREGNTFLNQKRLFRSGLETVNLTNPDWGFQVGLPAGRIARGGPPFRELNLG